MITENKTITIDPTVAEKISVWIKTRGGVLVWQNCNFSSQSLGSLAFTPANATTSPGWQYGNKPIRLVTDSNEFEVETHEEFARVRVIPSKYGPPCDPIAKGRAKVDAALEKAGEGSFWKFDWNSAEYESNWIDCVIMRRTGTAPLF